MIEFVAINSWQWQPSTSDSPDGDETVDTLVAAAGDLPFDELLAWVRGRITQR